MALNVGLDVSFDNMWERKEMQRKGEEVDSYKRMRRHPVEFTMDVTLLFLY
jgi:hypothetical protein